MTLTQACIDITGGIFAPGQLYVALSRVRSGVDVQVIGGASAGAVNNPLAEEARGFYRSAFATSAGLRRSGQPQSSAAAAATHSPNASAQTLDSRTSDSLVPHQFRHLSYIGAGVEVRASTIGKEAGLGLFATKDFRTGSMITEYGGELIDAMERKRRVALGIHSHIRTLTPMHSFIDGINLKPEPGVPGASFANDPCATTAVNTRFEKHDFDTGVERGKLYEIGRIFLQAVRDIKKNEELFVSYGKTYWTISSCQPLIKN
jgi:hypothetical protein